VVALLPAIAQSITAALLWCGVLIATIAWLLNPAVNLAGPTFAITPAPALIPATTELPAWHALALAPVCLFGFALCP
uniref:hypothetical protein n=1 Tax=Klebsiella pneumoniae TaxID=573 RepID=UPI003B9840CA